MNEVTEPSNTVKASRRAFRRKLVLLNLVIGVCVVVGMCFGYERIHTAREQQASMAKASQESVGDYPVSSQAVTNAIAAFSKRGSPVARDLIGCFKSWLSIQETLTYSELKICEFNVDTAYPNKGEAAYPGSLNTLREAQLKAMRTHLLI